MVTVPGKAGQLVSWSGGIPLRVLVPVLGSRISIVGYRKRFG
jgi:hypothetical protein